MLASTGRAALVELGLLNPDWPSWSVDTFILLGLGCVLLVGAEWVYDSRSRAGHVAIKRSNSSLNGGRTMVMKFRWFQCSYLAVYLTVMLADWLQGTNMYTLYQSYGVDVGTLFLTGFSSAAVFGTFLGVFVDRFGRRNGCVVFCLLEVAINVLEHVPDMQLLLLGRVLGGISTSLLFSAFESWMVSEHRKQGFPEEWLASTFSAATVGNGIMAILAGVLAQVASDSLGDIGPFQVAIALTVLALSLLMLWEENYGYAQDAAAGGAEQTGPRQQSGAEAAPQAASAGEKASILPAARGGALAAAAPETCDGHAIDGKTLARNGGTKRGGSGDRDAVGREDGVQGAASNGEGGGNAGAGGIGTGLRRSVWLAWRCIRSDPRVLLLGMVQSLFEGGTYTFVFMWVPTLQRLVPGGALPTGLIFSSFMVCITMGGILFSTMLRTMSLEYASTAVFATAAASMAVPAATRNFPTVLAAFLVLETCVGAFYSCSGLMRSRYIPDGLQSSVMNIFRLPLNVLVVVGTRMTDFASPETVFSVIACWFLTSALLQLGLSASSASRADGGSEQEKGSTAGGSESRDQHGQGVGDSDRLKSK